MKKQFFGMVAAAAIALAGGAAKAAVLYDLNVDNCGGSGCGYTSYGTISVTGQTTDTLTVDIELADNVIFNEAGGGAGGHEEVWFSTDTGSVTLGGLSGSFKSNGLQTAAANKPNGAAFGVFDYIIKYKPGSGNPSKASGGLSSLIFTITATNPKLQFSTVGTKDLYFVVDVAAFGSSAPGTPKTGHVGATFSSSGFPTSETPEPATWAMMLVGFGGMGALLRRRQRTLA